ncbi:MAG: carboxypeptidase-like regulatory domain-containing protein [Vicinamibacterales bacterium]
MTRDRRARRHGHEFLKTLAVAGILLLCVGPSWSALGARQRSGQVPAGQSAAGRIAGRVTGVADGRPIAGAVLRLLAPAIRVQKSARTDADGRFEFTELPAGSYQLSVQAEAYLPGAFGASSPGEPAKPIVLGDGAAFTEADFGLWHPSAVEGTVTDEFGDPVPGIEILISRLDFAAGKRRLFPVGGRSADHATDDQGHFRVPGLPPGEYYLTAVSGVFTERNETAGFAPTYYPSAIEAADAQPVRLALGQDATGLAFRLQPSTMASIRGRVLDAAGQPVGLATLMLFPADRGTVASLMLARGVTQADGSFELRNVPAGAFALQAFGRPEGGGNLGKSPFGAASIDVNGRDLRGVEVAVRPGAVIRGRIVFEDGTPPSIDPTRVQVSGLPVEFESNPIGGGPPNRTMNPDWTFEVENQFGLRVIRANIAAPGWSLKRITRDGTDITDAPTDFRSGDATGVEVVFTKAASSLSGRVQRDDGSPAENYTVVVFAADPRRWTFPSRYVAIGRPNQEGTYEVAGLPPANYLAIAVPRVEGTTWQDPAVLDQWRPLASGVTLGAGPATLDLRLVGR